MAMESYFSSGEALRELTVMGTDAPSTTPAILPPAMPYRALHIRLPAAMEGTRKTSASPATGLW